jgi:hypothetical protein
MVRISQSQHEKEVEEVKNDDVFAKVFATGLRRA